LQTSSHVGAQGLHSTLVSELRSRRRPDGGFSPGPAGQSELEPTAVALLALGDPGLARWLDARRRADGSFAELDGRPAGPAVTALTALALDGPNARRALASAIAVRGFPPPDAPDPNRRTAWGWTSDVRSTVEPTSRVLLAVNRHTPSDHRTRDEAIRLLRARRCADGGWNYGNASVNDVDLRGYAQTTAIALIALQHDAPDLVDSGMRFLRRRWRREPGSLTTAQSLIAFRLHGVQDELEPALRVLARETRRRTFLDEPLTVAWAALATGPDALLEPLRSRA
jgi:hypothetical protein